MDFAEQQRKPGKHLVAFSIVVVLHILLGYAFVSGLARKVIEVVKAPIETKIIEEVKPPPPPPENLPPPPKFAPPPPSFVPPPEVVVNPPPVQQPTITTTQETPPPQPPVLIRPTAPDAPPAPARVAAKPAIANAQSCAPTGDDYPSAALRAEATGLTRIRFTIDGEGRLQKAEIVKSAGSSREHKLLDRVAEQKLSTCKFTPGLDDTGKRVGGTFEFEYLWKIQ
ncbi:energy transducer TonB [Ideonella sp. BN130291]|uniref:energy transducer TonB n=1 Tax=Ideonella sp. BN130291 TaxID=3112940 RepID=UPI002E2654D6|nr:TonB family protein [Ideonella sp. BN130291]